jgi:D-inositol-3-phosphate glycosyltransferase
VVAADFTATQWQRAGFAAHEIHRIPYGIDLDHLRPPSPGERAAARAALGLPEEAYLIAFLGRLEPVKGVHVLAEAFGRVAADLPAAWLVLQGGPGREVGEDETERYLARVRDATDMERTTWLPPSPDVRPLMRAADVLAVPSTWQEPSGIVVAEAMAHGVPVVASKTGGMWEQMPPALEPYLVPPGDVAALAHALLALHGWQTRQSDLGRRLREHVRREKDLLAMAARVERLLLPLARR